jgi:hypothetical protein
MCHSCRQAVCLLFWAKTAGIVQKKLKERQETVSADFLPIPSLINGPAKSVDMHDLYKAIRSSWGNFQNPFCLR